MLKGFDACFDCQRIFRMILDSMARPGKINNINISSEITDEYQYDSMLKILITLLDNEVTFSMSTQMGEQFKKDVAGYTGSIISEIQSADFYIARGSDVNNEILQLKKGTLQFPDDSCTVIMAVNSIVRAVDECSLPASRLKLKGPGIKDYSFAAVEGLNFHNINLIKQRNVEYPLGIDAILVDDYGNVLCLPRTVKIEVEVD
jgi:alpha-D-ribose 1-methylphosphonate 5-triphosphate synthase subunit PhnH